MRIGVPKEIKIQENRVGLIPASVAELIAQGHEVFVETNAGLGIGFQDYDYQAAGAQIKAHSEEIFSHAQLIIKVKEPQPQECQLLTKDHILFTFLHLASNRLLTESVLQSGCTAIAYETITDAQGGLPLLAPMSQVAGRMSIQVAAHYLEEPCGGSGILLGGVPGVAPGHVLVLGAGQAGSHAVNMALGLEAKVTVFDKSVSRLQYLNELYGGKLTTVDATTQSIAEYIAQADVVIGSVLVPGASAPKLVTREMLGAMRKGSVLVDIAIDQGGCFETSKPTTHDNPVYKEEGIIHYCVTNMPGAVPRTSTFALNHVTLPFILTLANKGLKRALTDDPHFLAGLNIYQGQLTYQAVAQALKFRYIQIVSLI
jgi:alanine dehydrogenase